MDLNQLLFHHQVALMGANESVPGDHRHALARHYASRINSLQAKLGAFVTPFQSFARECAA